MIKYLEKKKLPIIGTTELIVDNNGKKLSDIVGKEKETYIEYNNTIPIKPMLENLLAYSVEEAVTYTYNSKYANGEHVYFNILILSIYKKSNTIHIQHSIPGSGLDIYITNNGGLSCGPVSSASAIGMTTEQIAVIYTKLDNYLSL